MSAAQARQANTTPPKKPKKGDVGGHLKRWNWDVWARGVFTVRTDEAIRATRNPTLRPANHRTEHHPDSTPGDQLGSVRGGHTSPRGGRCPTPPASAWVPRDGTRRIGREGNATTLSLHISPTYSIHFRRRSVKGGYSDRWAAY